MKKMLITFSVPFILILSFALLSCANGEQEKTVSMQEVPPAILKTFNDAYPGAAIKEYSEESEDGKTYYEISCTFEGRQIDAVYNPDGSVSAIEEVIPVESLPQAVNQAIAREVPQFSLKLAEKISKKSGIFYEVKLLDTRDQKTYELQFSESGELIEKEVKQNKAAMSGEKD